MESPNSPLSHLLLQPPPTAPTFTAKFPNKLSLIPLIFLIFFEVSGGPYGIESTVGAAGPFWAILGFLVFPFIWSIPEALITAELATAFPGNGGYVIWADRAFGPFWGSLMGSWKFFTGVLNLASYPVLCIDYVKLVFPIFSSGMLLEFGSFLWLRKKLPSIKRPFRVPMGMFGLVVMCLIPSGFLVYVMAAASKVVYLVTAILTCIGIFWYFLMGFCKSKMWIQFNNVGGELEYEE
ncbi:hypothetical protein JCGZ_01916 [Jatropha curcas]|uniref:Amino acid permease/ SLC12A domain-containing protein n=1 Tax=Jatropha curcas TaxID=180498 RepID=A0A067L4H4_JATCU|nr:probable polyamine transporter At3g13620 isoform X2 [Jatropha curcas]KDP42128.1 hypothetical protein JCGZ_01916 [Jatropha curcas]